MKNVLCLMLTVVFCAQAHSLTMGEKKKVEAAKQYLADDKESNNKQFLAKCGYSMPVTFDENMITPYMAANTSLTTYCEEPRGQMATLCEDAAAKKEISTKVKAIKCTEGKKDAMVLKLSGTTLQIAVAPGEPNEGDKIKKWLENNL